MKRRHFLQSSAILAAGAILSRCGVQASSGLLDKIGIQLFSLPSLLEQDFRKGIGMLANLGYREVEMYGPFPFSVEAAKERWQSITPSLGFSGSGYFGLPAKEVAAILKEHNMTAPSIHSDLETMQSNMGAMAEAAHLLGHEYVGIAAIPDDMRTNLDGYREPPKFLIALGLLPKKKG